jgi:two-component sensor histidine kinase
MPDQPPRLLYIDDDEGLCHLVRKDLQRAGYEVETALDGDAGIERLKAGGIDVVALDHHLPGRAGLDILRAIQKLPDPPPVVYVTGESQGRIAVAAMKAGAVDYVIKEVTGEFLTLLRSSVAFAIEARQMRRAKEAAEAELRASRDRFAALAAERELLIHEVNHRVANSLQMVSAFLRLQMSGTPGEDSRQALAAAIARVDAIGNVHKQLHVSSSVHVVDLPNYLEPLITGLAKGMAGADAAARVSISADPVVVSTETALAIGIIATELVINALKHAYPAGDPGAVRVRCVSDGRDGLLLSVEDDGRGIAADRPPGGSGLGQRIIGMLAGRLQAAIEQDGSHRGTRIVVRIPSAGERVVPAA